MINKNGGDYVLVLDDNMLKLAKMQETLLKVTAHNRQENLKKYKDIVIDIDRQAFLSLLDDLRQVNDHNQSLEDELQFLEMVSNYYNQLYELQLSFKNVCELYNDKELILSDLSRIDIKYINNRKSIIEGYLINLKNIDVNKKKLEILNKTLIEEEKNKIFLSKKLLEYEDILRKNFINSEGRIVVDGKLQYLSVISEYKKIGYDFNMLLVNKDSLDELLSDLNVEKLEMDEKYRTAEICYNSNPNITSKAIYDDISKEFFRVRYRLTLLKILELLSYDYDNYEQFKDKREKLLDLIKYRVICLKNLGERISVDPFARTKIDEQLNVTATFGDNSRKIMKIKNEILELSNLLDEMIVQNNDYRDQLSETSDLIIDNVSMSDIVSFVDVSSNVSLDVRKVCDNQVVSIKEIPIEFNKTKVMQKTSSVINRVNEMMFFSNDVISSKEIVNPELVIVSEPLDISYDFDSGLQINDVESEVIEEKNDETLNNNELDIPWLGSVILPEISINDSVEEAAVELVEDDGNIISSSYDSSMFETIDPFEHTPLFADRSDEMLPSLDDYDSVDELEIDNDGNKELPTDVVLNNNNIETDVFWVTQSENDNNLDDNSNVDLSFDAQISALLSNEDDLKIRKLVS